MDRKNGLTPCSRTKSSGVVRPPPNGCCGGESIFKLTIVKLKVGSKTSVFTKFVLKQQKQPSFISTAWTLGVECKSSALYNYDCCWYCLRRSFYELATIIPYTNDLLLFSVVAATVEAHHALISFFWVGSKIKLIIDFCNIEICPPEFIFDMA